METTETEPPYYLAQYHPHDLLIMKHFPGTDLRSMQPAERHHEERHQLYIRARIREGHRGQTPRVPWPMPPPRPYEETEVGVKEWRRTALQTIEHRGLLYGDTSTADHADRQTKSQYLPETCIQSVSWKAYRVLQVSELLENILRHATPSTQYAAWSVAFAWRCTVEHVFQSQYHIAYPCSPVGYSDYIKDETTWMQSTENELTWLAENPELPLQAAAFDTKNRFICARVTQARELPCHVSDIIDSLRLHAR